MGMSLLCYNLCVRRDNAPGRITDISSKLYAVIIGGFSVVTSLIYGVPVIKSHFAFAWDAILL